MQIGQMIQNLECNNYVYECTINECKLCEVILHLNQRFSENLKSVSTTVLVNGELVSNFIKNNIINEFDNQQNILSIEKKGWIQFDFCERKICVLSYKIINNCDICDYQKSWQIIGSNDGKNWEIIDERIIDLSQKSAICQSQYEIENVKENINQQNFHRYIRYIETNSRDTSFSCIEFSGCILSFPYEQEI